MKTYQEIGRNGELFIWKEGHSSLHNIMVTGENGVPLAVTDSLEGKCYVVDDTNEYITYHWAIDIDKTKNIPDEVWIELIKKGKVLHFCTTVEK